MDMKNFKTYRPVDHTDPGFEIPGVKLRWISGRAREQSNSRDTWVVITKDKMPKDLIEHVLRNYPNAFTTGNTIRRGDSELVLAYCTKDAHDRLKKELSDKSLDQVRSIRNVPKQEYVGKRDYAKVEHNEEMATSIPRQFLGKDEE